MRLIILPFLFSTVFWQFTVEVNPNNDDDNSNDKSKQLNKRNVNRRDPQESLDKLKDLYFMKKNEWKTRKKEINQELSNIESQRNEEEQDEVDNTLSKKQKELHEALQKGKLEMKKLKHQINRNENIEKSNLSIKKKLNTKNRTSHLKELTKEASDNQYHFTSNASNDKEKKTQYTEASEQDKYRQRRAPKKAEIIFRILIVLTLLCIIYHTFKSTFWEFIHRNDELLPHALKYS